MGTHRCQYRHDGFTSQFTPDIFSAFTSDNRHDHYNQCWMEGKHVGNFGTEEEPEYFCIFHAPDDKEPPAGFSKEDRQVLQPLVFQYLLTKWNEVNEKLGENERLTFALPGMQCFKATLDSFTFSHNVNFAGATFSGDASFAGAKFNSSAWFNGVEFDGRAYFNNSKFEQNILLQANSFNKGCWFTGSKFGNLKYSVHLGEKILFNDCSGAFIFTDQDCSKLSFLNMDLSNADFLGADIKNTRFEACRWKIPEKSSYSIVHQHEQILKDYKKSKSSGDGSVKKKAEDEIIKLRSLYLQLKKNLEEGHYFRQAGEFHYREMEIREMLEKRGLDWFMLWLYREFADFGESWGKLLICLLLSFAFSILFVFGWESLVGDSSLTLLESLKTVVKDVVPSVFRKRADFPYLHWGSKGFIILETVTALVLAALFAMSVRRRFRR